MSSRSAVTTLKIILIIDILIVAFAVGGYYYIQPQYGPAAVPLPPPPKPAEFQVTNLTLN